VGWQWRRTEEDDNEMSSLLATDSQKEGDEEEEKGEVADFVGLRLDKTGNRAHGYFGLVQALIPGR
jgi:hypothetical protein